MFDLLLRFDHHWRPSSGTECSVVDKETNRCARWIKEAIWIRKTKPTTNTDEGGYRLNHMWDSLLATPSSEQ